MDGSHVAGLVWQGARGMIPKMAKPHPAYYPWLLVGLLWMTSFLNAADRSILNSVKPLLREDFGITDVQLGLIDTTFFGSMPSARFCSGGSAIAFAAAI